MFFKLVWYIDDWPSIPPDTRLINIEHKSEKGLESSYIIPDSEMRENYGPEKKKWLVRVVKIMDL